MTDLKRMTNFELLRIIAMLMVVTMHYLLSAEILPALTDSVNEYHLLGLTLESFCIVAVNVYVLISGYFMVKTAFKFRRFLRLLFQTLFYTLMIPLVLSVLGLPLIAEQEGVYGMIKYILPVSAKHYWFISSYLLLYLLSPFLNAAFEKIAPAQMKKLLLILLLVFSGLKSVVPFSLNMDSFGYDPGWFICLYLTGAYLRIYGLPWLEKKNRGLLLYLLSAALIFSLKIGGYLLYAETGLFKYFYEIPFHYNFFPVYLAALGLFIAFMKVKIKEGRAAAAIRWAAPLSLGVYLLHMHVDISNNWYGWTGLLFGGLSEWGFIGMLLNLLVTVLFVYIFGIIIDFIRSRIAIAIEKSLLDAYYQK